MKGGKEEEKASSPMFPRLHVNDTDKGGGPRAPPRNKMALYEQLSIPSQRSSSSSLLLPPQNAKSLGQGSSQGNIQERNQFSPFYASSQMPACSAEKVNTHLSDGENTKTMKKELENRSIRHLNFRPINTSRPITESSSVRKRDHNANNSYSKRFEGGDDDDDFMVPTFVKYQDVLNLHKDTIRIKEKRSTPTHAASLPNDGPSRYNSSVQLASSSNRPLEQTNNTSDVRSGNHERSNQKLNDLNDAIVNKSNTKKPSSHPLAVEKLTGLSKFSKQCPELELNDRNVTDKVQHGRTCQESRVNIPGFVTDRNQDDSALRLRNESQPKPSFSHRSTSVTNTCNQRTDETENMPANLRDTERNDETSDTSIVDSLSGFEVSPDDVVGLIGPKQFWKARRAIVNQQRVFAIQVFELHRLMKVQKLLAASPHLLIEENPCVTTPQKVPTKSLPIEPYVKHQSETSKQKDDSQKLSNAANCRTESTGVQPFSAPPPSENKYGGGTHSHDPPSAPPASDNRSGPWCFQPPAQQWLVPVLSPSEGLIYKPYAGPCPPPATSLMPPPVYGNYSPMSYGVPQPHQPQNLAVLSGASPVAPSYFPNPYGSVPAMNLMIPNPAVEQVSAPPNGGQQAEQNSRSSCNMSFPRSDALTGRPLRFHASKDSELQGSTASSPCDRSQGRDVLSLFPMAPVAEGSSRHSQSSYKEPHTRVIRVVPHNARSATESAARIFKSIQEGRSQFDP